MHAARYPLLALLLGLTGAAWALGPEQEATCQRWADEEGVKGEERESYLRRCREQFEDEALPPGDSLYPGADSLLSAPADDGQGG